MADIFQEELGTGDEFSVVASNYKFGTREDSFCNEDSQEDSELQDVELQGLNNESDGNLNSLTNEDVHPVLKLRKLVESDIIYDRQVAARQVLETITEFADTEDEVHSVVSIICKLSDDSEGSVRSELVEHIPAIATFCRNHGPSLDFLIRQQLVPTTVKLTEDDQLQVRKIAQNSLLVLLERDLIDYTLLNEWICPHVAQQATNDNANMERRAEAVNMMCRMAPLVGHEVAVTCFLDAFVSLSKDVEFAIRKSCALNYGQFCRVIGEQAVEDVLLPNFFNLCFDPQWGVRKACADTFVDVSAVLLLERRKPLLPRFYISLLCDDSRWVRYSAYQNLGRFIATFADPSKTGLQYNPDGTWTCFEISGSQSLVSFSEIDDTDCYDLDLCVSSFEKQGVLNNEEGGVSADEKALNISDFDNPIAKTVSTLQFIDGTVDDTEMELTDSSLVSADCATKETIGEPAVLLVCTEDGSLQSESVVHDEENVPNPEVVASVTLTPKSEISDLLEKDWNCSAEGHHVTREDVDSVIRPILTQKRTRPSHSFSSTGSDFRSRSSERSRSASLSENPLTVTAKDGHVHLRLDSDNFFNNFQYWRTPLPEMELDVDIEDGKATSIHVRATALDKSDNVCASDFSIKISPKVEPCSEPNIKKENSLKMFVQTACVSKIFPSPSEDSVHVVQSSFDEASLTIVEGKIAELKQSHSDLGSDPRTSFDDASGLHDSISSDSFNLSPYDQDIVPPELLEKFIEMVEPKLSMLLDSEVTRYCAYCLPAVTYTVGRQNWACLRRMCVLLASDLQWKVRKTLACCLHELATVLGCEISTKDLFPLFLALLNDLDEVRMGLLQNLARFLKHISLKDRRKFLPYIDNFLKMDNERNWRFRYTLAQQLVPTAKLYSYSDVRQYLIPIAMVLVQDKVCDVRQAAIHLIAVIVWRVSRMPDTVLQLLKQLEEKLFDSCRWLWRQLYVTMCERLVIENSISVKFFAEHLSPNLLRLAIDPVPNVRLAVARCLTQTLTLDHISSIEGMGGEFVAVISALQQDSDRDVQHFARLGTGLLFESSNLDNLSNLLQNLQEFKLSPV